MAVYVFWGVLCGMGAFGEGIGVFWGCMVTNGCTGLQCFLFGVSH